VEIRNEARVEVLLREEEGLISVRCIATADLP
jgi:hypothetical protein